MLDFNMFNKLIFFFIYTMMVFIDIFYDFDKKELKEQGIVCPFPEQNHTWTSCRNYNLEH